MVKIIMHGCNGHMGQVISDLVAKDANAEIVAGIDIADKGNTTYPVFTDIKACQTEADVLIDFSSAKAADALLDYCTERNLPVVLCTTGLSEEQLAKVNWKVDTVFSHTCPYKYRPLEAMIHGIDQSTIDTTTEEWLDLIEDKLDYKKWYCGHWHINKRIDKMEFLFHDVRLF